MATFSVRKDSHVPHLNVALGDYPHTAALKDGRIAVDGMSVAFADITPINRAFAPMVRDLRFDLSELAIVTFLQARALGRPLVLLPVALACRYQEGALLCRADDRTIAGPADLRGKRIGVRAYSQTTGVWLRGILQDDFALAPEAMQWITFEGPHVAGLDDPSFVQRAAVGDDMLAMLRRDDLDAVIIGNDKPEGNDLRTVFADPQTAAKRFWTQHGFVPVNHVLVARQSLVADLPEAVEQFMRALAASYAVAEPADKGDPPLTLPFGRRAFLPSLELALRYATEQQLLPRPLNASALWDGTPANLARFGEAG